MVAATEFDSPPLGKIVVLLEKACADTQLARAIPLPEKAGLQICATVQEANCNIASFNDPSLEDELVSATVSNALMVCAPSRVEVVR